MQRAARSPPVRQSAKCLPNWLCGSRTSNRYTVRIVFLVSYRKHSMVRNSNRYIDRGTSAADFSSNPRLPFTLATRPWLVLKATIRTKINRKPARLETLVSHSKQRTAPQINRKLSGTTCFHFPVSLFHLPILPAHVELWQTRLFSGRDWRARSTDRFARRRRRNA